jgi:hypothetical protein
MAKIHQGQVLLSGSSPGGRLKVIEGLGRKVPISDSNIKVALREILRKEGKQEGLDWAVPHQRRRDTNDIPVVDQEDKWCESPGPVIGGWLRLRHFGIEESRCASGKTKSMRGQAYRASNEWLYRNPGRSSEEFQIYLYVRTTTIPAENGVGRVRGGYRGMVPCCVPEPGEPWNLYM